MQIAHWVGRLVDHFLVLSLNTLNTKKFCTLSGLSPQCECLHIKKKLAPGTKGQSNPTGLDPNTFLHFGLIQNVVDPSYSTLPWDKCGPLDLNIRYLTLSSKQITVRCQENKPLVNDSEQTSDSWFRLPTTTKEQDKIKRQSEPGN